MRVAVLNDIGQAVYHVGDEAMAHGAVHQLRQRGVRDILLLTRDPKDTRARFGCIATPTLQFPWPPPDRERYLGEIKAVMAGQTDALPPHDQVFHLIEQLRGVDALLIAGGGNMNSTYGWLLYERAAVAHIAATLGKPVVISGQTLGPVLSEPDAVVLRDLLSVARLVGLRESTSLELASRLCPQHPSLAGCLDDATTLPGVAPRVARPARVGRTLLGRPKIVATFSPATAAFDTEETTAAYAHLLDHLAAQTGGRVAFLPHMATPGAHDGDEQFHATIAAHMSAPATVAPIAGALPTARLTMRADMVITSRYHPVIFALSGGIPVLAVSPDQYTDVRIGGALGNWGMSRDTLPLASLMEGLRDPSRWVEVTERVDAFLRARTAMSATLRAAGPAILRSHAAWWDRVVAALESPWVR